MKKIIIGFLSVLLLAGCNCKQVQTTKVIHPDWTQNSVIYEVNVRQFTPEGTFRAFSEHLDRLSELGVDILWFMPIHPIGVEDRKGELGSYYSVMNYKDVNPEYGTLDDFKYTVDLAHCSDMKVVLDWVANHTSRDNVWVREHPDWYVRDSTGKMAYQYDWTDVARLDFSKKEVREGMLDAMKFWVVEYGIDGFRCDMAEHVPVDFWDYATKELREINPNLFFLAEAEQPYLQVKSFDAYYGWEHHHLMNDLAQGKINVTEYSNYWAEHDKRFPKNTIQLNFITNHDENSWSGSEFERMGDAVKQFAALTFAIPGMPMLYTGQEVGMNHRFEFFKRDPIQWIDTEHYSDFYHDLIALRKSHPSMFAPPSAGPLKVLVTSQPEKIFAFQRETEQYLTPETMTAMFNFTDEEVSFLLNNTEYTLPARGYQLIFN